MKPPTFGQPDNPQNWDDLKQRYLQASAEQTLHPSERVRQAVLAHAHMVAAQPTQPAQTLQAAQSRPVAANRWNFSLLASVAIAAMGTLLVLQWDRSGLQDKEVALEKPSVTAAPVAVPQSPPFASADMATNPSNPKQAIAPAHDNTAKQSANKPVRPAATVPASELSAPAANAVEKLPAQRKTAVADAPAAEMQSRSAATATAISPGEVLRSAARTGQMDQLELAVQQASAGLLNEQDSNGQTALMLATLGGHTAAVQRLLAAGANVGLKDAEGKTAAQMAAQRGLARIVNLLEKQPQAQ